MTDPQLLLPRGMAFVIGELLSEYRHRLGMTLVEAEEASGVGSKTIGSFETGSRVHAMKFTYLVALLNAYRVPLSQFVEDLNRELVPARRSA